MKCINIKEKMGKKGILIALACIFAVSLLFFFFSFCSLKSAPSENEMLEQVNFDATKAPDPVRNVVILSGSWNEMGFQFAEQYPDVVKRSVASGLSGLLSEHTYEEGLNALDKQLDYYEEHAPEVTELFKGLALGAGIDFDTVALGMGSFYGGGFCSTMAAWGDATKDGNLIAGANWDTESSDSYYMSTIIAYPEDGHAFVTDCGFFGNIAMNDKGVVIMGSSGQAANDEDYGFGLPVISPITFLAAKADTAKQGKNLYISDYAPGTGDNLNIADGKNAFIVEHTAAKDSVRKSGDFGEKDYLIATNDFMTDKMQDCLYSGDRYWDDNRPRYWTEEKILTDSFGKATPDTFASALGCNDFYIPENWRETGWHPMYPEEKLQTGWNKDVWNLDEWQGYYTPENREPTLKTVGKGIADPANKTMYIINGSSDTFVTGNSNATGNYMNVKLCKNYSDTAWNAQHYAYIQIWLGARDVSQSEGNVKDRIDNLNKAKDAMAAGEGYSYKAGVATTEETKMKFTGKAISKFCEAQCYAQLAQNNPTKIARDGADY